MALTLSLNSSGSRLNAAAVSVALPTRLMTTFSCESRSTDSMSLTPPWNDSASSKTLSLRFRSRSFSPMAYGAFRPVMCIICSTAGRPLRVI